MRDRLHKVLAAMGVASRRRAEAMIARGQVTVNGEVAQIGAMVDPETDCIVVDGQRLDTSPGKTYLALHKPSGYVSTVRSGHGEHTVLELVPVKERLFPVGRLDKDTSGLLLLTNDGEWANLVTHPRYGIEKEYIALIEGQISPKLVRRLSRGVELPDSSTTAPARIRRIREENGNTWLSITVSEGKKRQIRYMCGAVGHPVIELVRVREGPVLLGDLAIGAWRFLQQREVEGIREQARRTAVATDTRPEAQNRDRRSGGGG